MKTILEKALTRKVVVLSLSEGILYRALELYDLILAEKPHIVSNAQISAVGQCILRAKTLADAENKTKEFLTRQMLKLKKRVEAGGAVGSWLNPVVVAANSRPIGEILIDWVQNRRYMPTEQNDPSEPGLDVLKRFWSQFHVMIRFHKETGLRAF